MFTIEEPPEHVTFNSITDNPKWGVERSFAHIREVGTSEWSSQADLEAGKTYEVMAYYHNNGPIDAVGSFARANIPSIVDGEAKGTIVFGAENATPREVWSTLTFVSERPMELRVVGNSVKLHNFEEPVSGSTERTFDLPLELFAVGTPIGFDEMNGVLPGGNFHSGYIAFQVHVPPKMSFNKEVQLKSDNEDEREEWSKSTNANPGDVVRFRLHYMNIGNVNQNDVVISDVLPSELTYILDSTIIYDPNTPDGRKAKYDTITTAGINVGNFAPGGYAYVVFEAKIADKEVFECEIITLENKGSVDTANGGIDSFAIIVIDNSGNNPIAESINFVVAGSILVALLAFFKSCWCSEPARRYWELRIESEKSQEEHECRQAKARWRRILASNMVATVLLSTIISMAILLLLMLIVDFIF